MVLLLGLYMIWSRECFETCFTSHNPYNWSSYSVQHLCFCYWTVTECSVELNQVCDLDVETTVTERKFELIIVLQIKIIFGVQLWMLISVWNEWCVFIQDLGCFIRLRLCLLSIPCNVKIWVIFFFSWILFIELTIDSFFSRIFS